MGRLFEETLGVAGVGEEVQGTGFCGGRERSWDDRRFQPVPVGGCVLFDLLAEDSALRDCGGILRRFGVYPATYGPVVTESAVVNGMPDGNVESWCCWLVTPPLVAGRRAGLRGGTGGPADDTVDGLQFEDFEFEDFEDLVVTALKKTS